MKASEQILQNIMIFVNFTFVKIISELYTDFFHECKDMKEF